MNLATNTVLEGKEKIIVTEVTTMHAITITAMDTVTTNHIRCHHQKM